MKYTLEFVFIERWRDAVLSTYKMAAQTHAKQCLFVQLRKWPPARMPGRVYRPVRPLVLYITLWFTFTVSHPLLYLYTIQREILSERAIKIKEFFTRHLAILTINMYQQHHFKIYWNIVHFHCIASITLFVYNSKRKIIGTSKNFQLRRLTEFVFEFFNSNVFRG